MRKSYTKKNFFYLVLGLLFLVSGLTFGQAPSVYGTASITAPTEDFNNVPGYGDNFSTSNTYQLRFGRASTGAVGSYPILSYFDMPSGVSSGRYYPIPRADGKPFTRIVFNRVANSTITNLRALLKTQLSKIARYLPILWYNNHS